MVRITVATPLIAALALAACGPKAEQKTDAAADSVEQGMEATGSAVSNAASDVAAAVTPTPTGQDFLNTAAKSDAFEIAAAKLAQTNGASADVKAFAAEMVKAHTDSTAKMKAAASKAQPALIPDAALTADQQEDLAELGKLKGAKFDEEYIDGQVDAHQDALALMQTYASNGEVGPLRDAAGQIAPVVSHHLDQAKALDKTR